MATIKKILEIRVERSEVKYIRALFWQIHLLVCKHFAVLEISPAFKSEMRLEKEIVRYLHTYMKRPLKL